MRFSSIIIRTGLILALGLFSACSDESSNINQLNQNEFALRGMIASDRQQIDALRADLRRTQDDLAEMKHGSGESAGAAAPADVNDRIAKLESEVNAMQAAMPAPAPVPGTEAPGTPPGPGASTISPPPPGAPAETPPAPGGASAASTEPTPTWPQELDQELTNSQNSKEPGAKIYRKGLEAMKAGNYPTAIIEFAKVQHNYPKSPLSEPAQYFTANAFYESTKYEQAILQFNDLTMRFPNSKFLCESLLREGQSFVKLQDRIDARLTLQKLASNTTCSAQASDANNMLKDLGSD